MLLLLNYMVPWDYLAHTLYVKKNFAKKCCNVTDVTFFNVSTEQTKKRVWYFLISICSVYTKNPYFRIFWGRFNWTETVLII